MDISKKKPLIIFFIALIGMLILSHYYIEVALTGASLTSIYYSAKNRNLILLMLGLMGIFAVTLVRNRKKSREGFQIPTDNVKTVPMKSELPEKKTKNPFLGVAVSIDKYEDLIFMFKSFLGFDENAALRIVREENLSNIFDAIQASIRYNYNEKTDINLNDWKRLNYSVFDLHKYYPIYNLTITEAIDLVKNPDKDVEIFADKSLNKLSRDYYLGVKKFSLKHYKFFQEIGVINEEYKNKIKVLKSNVVYFDEKIKDYGSLMILIEYLGFLSADDISSDSFEDDDILGKQWTVDTFKRVDLNLIEFNTNYYLKKYKIKNKIQNYLEKIKFEKQGKNKDDFIDFKSRSSLLFEELNNKDIETDGLNRDIQTKSIEEYQKVVIENSDFEKKDEIFELQNYDTIRDKSMIAYYNIIDETKLLIEKLKQSEDSSILNRYLAFFMGFINILVKEQRLFFVGILLVILSVIFNFIEISR